MKTRRLAARGGTLDLTTLGFGGAPLGNLYKAIPEPEAQATLQAAWDAGIRMFDTAPQYGFGLSEQRYGKAIAKWPREEFVLSTKVGRVLRERRPDEKSPADQFIDAPDLSFDYDYSYDGIMRSWESSKTRLGVDRADILLVHDIGDLFTHNGDRAKADHYVRELFDRGGYRAITELQSAGVVKAIGAGVNEWQVCERLLGMADFDCFLLAGRYTLLEQESLATFLPLCEKRGVGIILGGPFNSGILATGPVAGAYYNYSPAPPAVLERVRRIEAVCRAHGVKLIEAALHFPLGHPAVKTIIPGANSPDQVRANVALLDAKIPAALWSDLKGEGLLRPETPVPTETFV